MADLNKSDFHKEVDRFAKAATAMAEATGSEIIPREPNMDDLRETHPLAALQLSDTGLHWRVIKKSDEEIEQIIQSYARKQFNYRGDLT